MFMMKVSDYLLSFNLVVVYYVCTFLINLLLCVAVQGFAASVSRRREEKV